MSGPNVWRMTWRQCCEIGERRWLSFLMKLCIECMTNHENSVMQILKEFPYMYSNRKYGKSNRSSRGRRSTLRILTQGITSNLTLLNSSNQIPWIKKYYMEDGNFILKSKPIGYKTKSKPIGYKMKSKPIGYTNEKKANRLCKWKESQSALQMKRKDTTG